MGPADVRAYRRRVGKAIVASTLFFAALRYPVRWLIHASLPMAPRYADLYGLSIVNAAAISGFGLYKLLACKDFGDVAHNFDAMCFLFGYLLHDLIATRHDWATHRANLFHHIAGLGLLTTVLANRTTVPLVPSFALVETSTVFLNIMWFMRVAHAQGSAAYKGCMAAFVSSFFLLRVVGMPYNLWRTRRQIPEAYRALGRARYCLHGLCALQWYWFSLVLKQVVALAR